MLLGYKILAVDTLVIITKITIEMKKNLASEYENCKVLLASEINPTTKKCFNYLIFNWWKVFLPF